MIAKYGPVIKCSAEGKTTFLKAREDICMDKLKSGEYTIDDIVACKKQSSDRMLGSHKESTVVLKKSKYGLYVEWNKSKIKLLNDVTEYETIELMDVVDHLVNPILLEISEDITLRNGKYGAYIYYKTKKMKKPRFISLDKSISSESNVATIKEWLRNKHQISIAK
jgi:DNA topoisomerase-1